MAYKKVTRQNGMRILTSYEEVKEDIPLEKGKIRKEISEKVCDRDTLIADLFKLNFLTISALNAVYKVINKDDIPDEVKALLDDSFEKYENTKTIMDLYLENGDTSFIDRMLERQGEITNIIESKS